MRYGSRHFSFRCRDVDFGDGFDTDYLPGRIEVKLDGLIEILTLRGITSLLEFVVLKHRFRLGDFSLFFDQVVGAWLLHSMVNIRLVRYLTMLLLYRIVSTMVIFQGGFLGKWLDKILKAFLLTEGITSSNCGGHNIMILDKRFTLATL